MELFTLSVFNGEDTITEGWNFSEDATLLIKGRSFGNHAFRHVKCDKAFKGCLVRDGYLFSPIRKDHAPILYSDREKEKNKDKFLILVVTDRHVTLPQQVFYGHRIKVSPVKNQDRSLTATVLVCSKAEKLRFVFNGRPVIVEYDQSKGRPVARPESWFESKLRKICILMFLIPRRRKRLMARD